MSNKTFVLWLLLLGVTSCNEGRIIDKGVVSFYKQDKSLDSIIIFDRTELQTIEKYLSTKTIYIDKLPVKYFLKLEYRNGKSEEYSGNSYFLKDNKMYVNTDTVIRNNFLKVINSKLPSYLQQ